MSTKLFTYRDLLRIHQSVTPTRAPGRASVELIQIGLLITDLLDDAVASVQEMIDLGILTFPRDFVFEIARRVIRLGIRLGISASDLLAEFLGPPPTEEE